MTAPLAHANHSMVDLLNRLAVKVQPKQPMLDEFGTLVTEAFTKKFISEDFYNYGITDLGMTKRDALRAGINRAVTVPVLKPVSEPASTTASQEPAMNLHVKKLLEIIGRFENGATLTELEVETSNSTPTLRLRINELLKQNSITRIGEGLPGKPYRYCTPEQAVGIELDAIENESVKPEPIQSEPVKPVVTPEAKTACVLEKFGAITVNPPKLALEFQPALLNLEQPAGLDLEITAMQTMLAALEPLDDMARSRALGWVSSRLRMS